MDSGLTLRVPASSANLGPGFDALGLALGIYLECWFSPRESLEIQASGRDSASISCGEDNMIWQTALRVARDQQRKMPPIFLEIRNDIPLGKGLGSSAAALTAGVMIANQILGLRWGKYRVLDEAARIEGHPDNVAACVLGSIVASAVDRDGVARAVRIELPECLGIAVVVPDYVLPTSQARAVLPEVVDRADAVFNVQRSALLVAALATGTLEPFPAALEDRLHQPYRAPLVPGLSEILELRAPGLLGCALSGAGPSVLVFHRRDEPGATERVREIFARNGSASEVLATTVALEGCSLKPSRRPSEVPTGPRVGVD